MAQSRGPKRAAYQKAYNAHPEEQERIKAMGRARTKYEKEVGPIPKGHDLDHKKPVRAGGSYALKNLTPKKPSEHRAWNKKGGKK